MNLPCTRVPALMSFLFLTILLTGCNADRDIRDYYFPARELTTGLVYAYENIGTLPGPEIDYTYYLGVDVDTALYLSVTQYSQFLEPKQQSRQEIKNDGVYLREITLLRPDTSGPSLPMPTTLIHDRAFPFYLSDEATEAYGYRLSFTDPDRPQTLTYVTMNRRFERDTTIEVLGKNYPGLLFSLEGEVSLRDTEEGDISPQFTGYEIYAKGLGLVEHKRELGSGASLGGRLQERLTMEDFLERVR
ncbi:hypothetical protein [Neolewinella persica]|uniref:hypothetical protein n=1 Tax=Neolewinella persica TaxID=70998 RepID=UPI00037E46EE|nr:hypothetical protein [Neolewinella persica]